MKYRCKRLAEDSGESSSEDSGNPLTGRRAKDSRKSAEAAGQLMKFGNAGAGFWVCSDGPQPPAARTLGKFPRFPHILPVSVNRDGTYAPVDSEGLKEMMHIKCLGSGWHAV